ncbi:sodium:alanine symporter family protein [Candidatus Palauibacter soopunensis]|uniref:alanine/glycine:cation symporter family protein n=1 Tax=Candidatus Palauibacter soopunensis TaxID=3056739 RepID=UPI00238EFEF7|nr:sodium:alanine symporter family protein [Candidatus Palauibacter soopunensis]MDE2879884.1 sodium:alanine symporter family protein [Candidatus Palauibacter soopunensis]
MDFATIVDWLDRNVAQFGITIGGERLTLQVLLLLGIGTYLTLRLGLPQIRKFAHGVAVATGRYDDPNDPGDVSHFQALTTALSATVGIGNIAGAAIAIHLGGPGALFWMWMTAFLGMATKYSEVTLAQKYREVDESSAKYSGTVSGGPMYYIEKGLGPRWKPVAAFFAVMLGLTAFMTGNANQANTVADAMLAEFGIAKWITGLTTSTIVALVILGGIKRIGRVTSILAPFMAIVYVTAAMIIIILNLDQVPGTFALIFSEAFNPTAGVAGTGVGAFLVTLMWGVRRGLFSNEAGQGSAPIAHAAAKTDEPVSEGVVALLEPFIDTIVIVTMTALVVIMTGAWNSQVPTAIQLEGGDISYVVLDEGGSSVPTEPTGTIRYTIGRPGVTSEPHLAWHEVSVPQLFEDEAQTQPFSGAVDPARAVAIADDGRELAVLYGQAYETGAPLTQMGFQRGLSPLGDWGHYIVIFSVFLFAISTAISWSYYGDRCANYLFGPNAIIPYKLVFVAMHFVGAVLPLAVVWSLGDIFLAIVIIPNLIALIFLAPQIKEMTESYFTRSPWERHRRH